MGHSYLISSWILQILWSHVSSLVDSLQLLPSFLVIKLWICFSMLRVYWTIPPSNLSLNTKYHSHWTSHFCLINALASLVWATALWIHLISTGLRDLTKLIESLKLPTSISILASPFSLLLGQFGISIFLFITQINDPAVPSDCIVHFTCNCNILSRISMNKHLCAGTDDQH